MDELMNSINEHRLIEESTEHSTELTTSNLRSVHTYTIVLEFFVKTIRVSMSLN